MNFLLKRKLEVITWLSKENSHAAVSSQQSTKMFLLLLKFICYFKLLFLKNLSILNYAERDYWLIIAVIYNNRPFRAETKSLLISVPVLLRLWLNRKTEGWWSHCLLFRPGEIFAEITRPILFCLFVCFFIEKQTDKQKEVKTNQTKNPCNFVLSLKPLEFPIKLQKKSSGNHKPSCNRVRCFFLHFCKEVHLKLWSQWELLN